MTYFTSPSEFVSPTISEEPIARAAAKKCVQIGEFAALPLVTHPDSFLVGSSDEVDETRRKYRCA